MELNKLFPKIRCLYKIEIESSYWLIPYSNLYGLNFSSKRKGCGVQPHRGVMLVESEKNTLQKLRRSAILVERN